MHGQQSTISHSIHDSQTTTNHSLAQQQDGVTDSSGDCPPFCILAERVPHLARAWPQQQAAQTGKASTCGKRRMADHGTATMNDGKMHSNPMQARGGTANGAGQSVPEELSSIACSHSACSPRICVSASAAPAIIWPANATVAEMSGPMANAEKALPARLAHRGVAGMSGTVLHMLGAHPIKLMYSHPSRGRMLQLGPWLTRITTVLDPTS
eukprot:4436294-Lingulodinium_polyedra.AAC.1